MSKLTLILGGSNSGKSRFAESLIKNQKDVLYLATAEPIDEEMKLKLQKHRQSRPREWKTIEEPIHIDKVIEKEGNKFSAVLVECILLYINNIMRQVAATKRSCRSSEQTKKTCSNNKFLQSNSIITKFSHFPDDEVEKIVMDKIVHTLEVIKSSKAVFYIVSGEVGLGLIGENKSVRLYSRILGQVNQFIAEKADEVFLVVSGIPMQIK